MNRTLLLFLLAWCTFFFADAQEEARLLRFPCIHNNQVVFSYAGDLYSVDATGGMARRLTSHVGYEMFPRFSHDGKQIAFTGEYDGNREVYIMPSEGGSPRRLTFTATLSRDDISDRMGPNNIVMCWTPDNKNITFRSRKRSFNSFIGHLNNVSTDGSLPEEIELAEGGFCSWSDDGKKLAFNRVFREFRTWKNYRGGMADDIWIFDTETGEVNSITDHPAQDIIPMWKGNSIFFLSDRDGRMNLYVYHIQTKQTEQLTNFTTFDIKFPSIGNNHIVFEHGGYIYKLHVNEKEPVKIPVYISNDQVYARKTMKDAGKIIRGGHLSPNGERAVFAGRGDIYTIPAKKGITRNLTKTSSVHEREPVWSPCGKYIAYLSDKTGEYEIYIEKHDGSEPAEQVTKNADTYKFMINWSPDGKKIAWHDRKLRLQYVDVKTKSITVVATSTRQVINDYNWSPDSKWMVYTDMDDNRMPVVNLYNTETGKTHRVTDNWHYSKYGTFSSDGKYLFFVSGREFNPVYSNTEWNHAYIDMEKIYMVTLHEATPSPFAPENNEVEINQDKNREDKETEEVKITVDFEGLQNRVIALPVKASNYYNLISVGDKLYYNEYSSKNGDGNAKFFDLDTKKETVLGQDMIFTISDKNNKMLVKKNKSYAIIDLPTSSVSIEKTLDLSNMQVWVDMHAEWQQIYDECWRQMRDFFYAHNMHGIDWDTIHDRYEVLIPHVNHRDDLTYVIGEMIGELRAGHAYINNGDKPEADKIKTGLLGVQLTRHASGYYKIENILEGANWNDKLRSPLNEVGMNVNEGDYIISINGELTKGMNNIYQALLGKANKEVIITIYNKPEKDDARDVIIVPTADEAQLYYHKWVQRNIAKVDKATNGQVGYIHIPDMSVDGLNEFAKHFYPQLNKKGLIIDDRGNGGGNVSPMIIERLRREVTRQAMQRGVPEAYTIPRQMMHGPMVTLVDKYSASDGDLFAYSFKKHNLGKLIGTRTWGGVVGITGSLPFIDGTDMRKPEYASFSAEESEWIIENHGVKPDIVIDNDPHQQYLGNDKQLDHAIKIILEEIQENYKELPPIPEPPVKK